MLEPITAIVIRRTKGFYYLRTIDGQEIECKAKGALFKNSRYDNQIAVGDQVNIQMTENQEIGMITGICERKSFLSRVRVGIQAEQVIAANVDLLFITISAKDPEPRPGLIWRMLVAANIGKVRPILVLTKLDLIHHNQHPAVLQPFENIDLEILYSSKGGGKDDNRLADLVGENTSVFVGHSGVGKSSLINRLFPGLELKVGAVNDKTNKGSHTTTYAQMIQVAESGFVIDTPGVREFGFWQLEKQNIRDYFPVIRQYSGHCKHSDCIHIHEPHCFVKNEVDAGRIHPELYRGYVKLMEGEGGSRPVN